MTDMEKFKKLVHYICFISPTPLSLGKTKLNKILWFAEREVYLKYGEPLTGMKFIKMPYGPVPQQMDEALNELQIEKHLLIKDTKWNGRPKVEFIVLDEPSPEVFKPKHLMSVNNAVLAICKNHTAETISKVSHDSIWEMAVLGEEIPLYAAFGKPGELQIEDVQWAMEQVASL
jgi:hypothetical protein